MAKVDVEHPPAGSKLELYISPDCPYCTRAMAYYDHEGIAYTQYDAENDASLRKKMFEYTNSDPTVPAIIIDGTYIQSGWGTPPRG
jgi:glutaredoxin 3